MCEIFVIILVAKVVFSSTKLLSNSDLQLLQSVQKTGCEDSDEILVLETYLATQILQLLPGVQKTGYQDSHE